MQYAYAVLPCKWHHLEPYLYLPGIDSELLRKLRADRERRKRVRREYSFQQCLSTVARHPPAFQGVQPASLCCLMG